MFVMRSAFRSSLVIAAATMLGLQAAGCAKGERQKPMLLGPVDAGAGSLEAIRRELAATWSLNRLEVIAPDGARRQVAARGTLSYDAYGALAIKGVVDDPSRPAALVLDYSGRIVIDPAKKEFRPADFESATPVDAAQVAPVSLDKVRRFELGGDRLAITYLDAAGKPTAETVWNRTGR
jgi:hypothetical protein